MTQPISVVITCRPEQRYEPLARAVSAVRAQSVPAAEVIVVVDHNPELFARAAAGLPGVTVLTSGYASGLAGARDTGVARAEYPLVALLVADDVPPVSWLAGLVARAGTGAVVRRGRLFRTAHLAVRRDAFLAAGGFRGRPAVTAR